MSRRIMRTLLAINLIFSLLSSANASTLLSRSVFLGLVPNGGADANRVEIQRLHPDGTGVALGMKSGDVVTKINDISITSFPTLLRALDNYAEGDELTIGVERDGQQVTFNGVAKSRPKEKGQGYRVEYQQFDWNNNAIRSIHYIPDTPRNDRATVMFIQGYTCGSIDYGMVPNLTINQILGHFAQAGFNVFKMEKPGVGDSQGELDCMSIDFDTEHQAFAAGLQHLAKQPHVNSDNIFAFGHSLGVLHVGLLAKNQKLKGVIGYGGVLKSWYNYMLDMYEKQSFKYWGVSKQQAVANKNRNQPFLNDWLNTDMPWPELKKKHLTGSSAIEPMNAVLDQQVILDRHYTFFRNLNGVNFTEVWNAVKTNALMIHGTFDIQAIEPNWAHDIAAIVNKNHPNYAKAIEVANTEHSFVKYKSLEELMAAMRNRQHRPGNPGDRYSPEIAERTLEWMKDKLDG